MGSQLDLAAYLRSMLHERQVMFDQLRCSAPRRETAQTNFLVHALGTDATPDALPRIYRITVEAL